MRTAEGGYGALGSTKLQEDIAKKMPCFGFVVVPEPILYRKSDYTEELDTLPEICVEGASGHWETDQTKYQQHKSSKSWGE